LHLKINLVQFNQILSSNPKFILIGGFHITGESIKKIKKAINNLEKGKFILIYDNEKREGETDLVMSSKFVKPDSIKTMRKEGGGLIFLMTSKEIANKLELPFLSEMYSNIEDKYPILKELVPDDIPYDTKSSFSLTINHRDTFTGITDIDRSLTMTKFAEITKKIAKKENGVATKIFGKEFRSPGHIPICVASEGLLRKRKGHTELVISMMEMAKLPPAGSGCEMIGDSGKALPKKDAIKYAHKNNLIFLEGKEIIEAWEKWSK